jgi:peroxiredoxin
LRRWLRAALLGAAILALGAWAFTWLSAPPRVEPHFDTMKGPWAGPVKDFALRDARGTMHTTAEWRGRPAVVLAFITTAGPASDRIVAELQRLARRFSPLEVLFLGIVTDGPKTAESAADRAIQGRLPFPILLDPSRSASRQAGVRSTSEAVVLGADGQVFYRGRIGADSELDRHGGPRSRINALEMAIEATLADEMPVVATTEPSGPPLPATKDERDANASEVTFSADVAPILWKNCVRCHRPGEVGPFSLLTYRDAAKRAGFIYDVAASGRMPPWKPLPGVGVFVDAARLSATEIETLRRWVDGGCEPGNPAELPAPPRFSTGWQLGQPDIVLTMPETYVVPAGGPDIYRSFCLPVSLDRDVTVNGIEFRPGNRRVTHHSRIYFDDTGDARRRDDADIEPGFGGRLGAGGGFELPYPGLGAWTPGMTPRFAPDGVGRAIRRGSDIVLQIHYHPSGKPETDRSSIGLYIARKPTTMTMSGYTLCTDRIDIPAGEKRHRIILSTRLKADVHLYTVVPHAHYLCREIRLAATIPDATTLPLLWITDWDMDWQDQYRYAKPVRLPRGTVLTLAAYFDNSADNPRNPNKPPRRVRYGVETKDEMCACHLEFVCDDAADRDAYKQKSPFGL